MLREQERATKIALELEKSKNNAQYGTYTLPNWRGSQLTLLVIMLDNNCMAYNTSDPRSASMRFQYCRQHSGADLSFFQNRNDEDVQKAQEEILQYMVKNRYFGEAILENPVVRGREPVLLTAKGYIVKGNVSVAILREIGEKNLYCAVLPEDATDDEIKNFSDAY